VLLLMIPLKLFPIIRVPAPESEPTAWLLAVDRLAPDATVRSVPAANVCALDSARLPATMVIVVWPAAMAASERLRQHIDCTVPISARRKFEGKAVAPVGKEIAGRLEQRVDAHFHGHRYDIS